MFKNFIKERITPFFILAILNLFFAIYLIFTGVEWDILIAFVLIGLSIVVYFIDFGLKKLFKNQKKIIIGQLIFILFGFAFNNFPRKTITLEIDSKFDEGYVAIIYGVESGKDISTSFFTRNNVLEIPNKGILLVSSEFEDDTRETKIRLKSGVYLNSDETEKGFVQSFENELYLDGKKYNFRSWKIQNELCCYFINEETEKHKLELISELKKVSTHKHSK